MSVISPLDREVINLPEEVISFTDVSADGTPEFPNIDFANTEHGALQYTTAAIRFILDASGLEAHLKQEEISLDVDGINYSDFIPELFYKSADDAIKAVTASPNQCVSRNIAGAEKILIAENYDLFDILQAGEIAVQVARDYKETMRSHPSAQKS